MDGRTNAAQAETSLLRPIDFVVTRHKVRPVNAAHKAAVKAKIERMGFLPQHPLCVTEDGALWAGNHRYEAALELGLEVVPMLVAPCPASLDRAALEDNDASADALATTFVDLAELVWRKLNGGMTQHAAADEIGWSRDNVAKYAALRGICLEAWMIVTKSVRSGTSDGERAVTANVTDGTFSENLLRSILPLPPEQQLDLVSRLAQGEIDKGKFKKQAEVLRIRNEAAAWLEKELVAVAPELVADALQDVAKGRYDAEWSTSSGPGTGLLKLAETKRNVHQNQHGISLLQGDFDVEIAKVPDGSIDAIITDPPLNISKYRSFRRSDGSDIDIHFGSWDEMDRSELLSDVKSWAAAFFRVLKPGGSGFLFVGERYLNHVQEIFERAGFEIKGTFFWCRTNPGVSMTKADVMPAMDLAIQFVKPGAQRTFNYPGDADGAGLNWQRFPICGGNERLKRPVEKTRPGKSDSLHPTQKPEAVILYLMELITVSGDTVLDGFMGVGTTAAVAKANGRRFIGFEIDPEFFDAAARRLAS